MCWRIRLTRWITTSPSRRIDSRKPVLHVSTSGTDSDWVVKLIDVYPNDYPSPDPNPKEVRMGGYQQLVRGEPLRGKFRNSLSKPEPFTPGQPAKIEFSMPDICHTFRPAHRIMVQIQSLRLSLIDRNPQQFLEIPKAGARDFKKATERVYRGSNIKVQVTVSLLPELTLGSGRADHGVAWLALEGGVELGHVL